jgi:hypothetical protein
MEAAGRRRPALAPEEALALLCDGTLTVHGRLPWSSNATYLVELADEDRRCALAVYKPQRGERPLWDFPSGTLCHREAAAYLVSEALGWGLVPPTVVREGPWGCGALQLFVEHDPELHYLALDDPDVAAVQRLVAFDAVINNADRKSGHVLVGDDGRLWAIDHGVAFHVEPKLRTVIWEHAGERLPDDLRADLRRLAEALDDEAPGSAGNELAALLTAPEARATARRARSLARRGTFPDADPSRRAIPWPPV